MADENLKSIVRSYALDIEAAADGTLYKVNGEPTVIEDIDDWKQKEWERKKEEFLEEYEKNHGTRELDFDPDLYGTEEEFLEDEIGTVDDVDEPEQMSVMDYVNDDSLGDVRFEVDGKMECYGGKVLLAFGGPNVWLHDDEIRGYWGGDTETWSLCSDARDALMEFFQEEWNMVRDSHSR